MDFLNDHIMTSGVCRRVNSSYQNTNRFATLSSVNKYSEYVQECSFLKQNSCKIIQTYPTIMEENENFV
eukprot:snap_masked-scaffold_4-processed-gene-11.51-mRNA-1 protein AED:1.00 eAED:1.00 QI:0/0/0/0/1/1/2/0/68